MYIVHHWTHNSTCVHVSCSVHVVFFVLDNTQLHT